VLRSRDLAGRRMQGDSVSDDGYWWRRGRGSARPSFALRSGHHYPPDTPLGGPGRSHGPYAATVSTVKTRRQGDNAPVLGTVVVGRTHAGHKFSPPGPLWLVAIDTSTRRETPLGGSGCPQCCWAGQAARRRWGRSVPRGLQPYGSIVPTVGTVRPLQRDRVTCQVTTKPQNGLPSSARSRSHP
jgi:hypothetical protein